MKDEEKGQLLIFFVQYYKLNGTLLSKEAAKSNGIPEDLYDEAIKSKDFKAGLLEQGIDVARYELSGWGAKALTPEQLIVADTLLDLVDQRSNKKKLQDLGVSSKTYQAWLKDPVFQDYMRTRSQNLIGENQHEVDLALLDKVMAGDMKAIAYMNEFTGRFVQQRGPQGTTAADVQRIIISIIEIVDEEVLDSEIKMRIGNRLKGLIQNNNTAAELAGMPPPIPIMAEPITMPSGETVVGKGELAL